MSRNRVHGELLVDNKSIWFCTRMSEWHPNIQNNYKFEVPVLLAVALSMREKMPIIAGMYAYADINWWAKDNPKNVTGAGFIENISLSNTQDCDIIRQAYKLQPYIEGQQNIPLAFNCKYNHKIELPLSINPAK